MAEHIKFFEENEIANLVRNNIFNFENSNLDKSDNQINFYYGEFDPGSGLTLAAGIIHASWTRLVLAIELF